MVTSFYLQSELLFCPYRRAMIDRSTKSHQYYYYTCSRIYKQDKEACNARAISKEKLERLVIEKLQSKLLTDSNLEELVKLVNRGLVSFSSRLKEWLDICYAEIRDVELRLSRLYDVLETVSFVWILSHEAQMVNKNAGFWVCNWTFVLFICHSCIPLSSMAKVTLFNKSTNCSLLCTSFYLPKLLG